MSQWFARYTQREQMALVAMALAVGLYILYAFIWSPLTQKRDALRESNQGVASSLQRVDGMAAEISQLRASGKAGSSRRNLTSLVNQSTRARGIEVSRLQPNSRGDIQVRLEEVSFDGLVAWLHDMEYREGLLLSEVAITQTSDSGLINATIRIAQGS
ncbi:MAG: type II secretion system protein M [Pseudomonadota bacterium]